MSKAPNSGAWMPSCTGCPLSLHPGEENIYVRELCFTYSCPEDCACCPIVKKVERHMLPRIAKQKIDEAVATAERCGMDAVYIHFSGGDPLYRFSEFQEICDYALEIKTKVRLGLYAVSCFRNTDAEKLSWLRRRAGVLTFGVRYDRLLLDGAIPGSLLALFHQCGYYLIHRFERGGLDKAADDIAAACGYGLPVRLEYDNASRWSREDIDSYVKGLAGGMAKLRSVPGAAECVNSLAYERKCFQEAGNVTVNSVDTTRTVYLCARCSPLRLKQRELEGRDIFRLINDYRRTHCAKCDLGGACFPCSAELHSVAEEARTHSAADCNIMRVNRLITNKINSVQEEHHGKPV